ncbi:hypothetical protein BTE77_24895 [Ensifer adhaerens]|jgi:hypothetical protein|nr:hypothetical protein BTE77_24895 [Ensifer adhaerens]
MAGPKISFWQVRIVHLVAIFDLARRNDMGFKLPTGGGNELAWLSGKSGFAGSTEILPENSFLEGTCTSIR